MKALNDDKTKADEEVVAEETVTKKEDKADS